MGYSQLFMCFFIFHCVSLIRGEGCIYDPFGLCLRQCPPGTYSYVSPCGFRKAMSKRTCRSPKPLSMGVICDYSHCECYEPKVWDEAAFKCVLLEDCPERSKE